MRKRLLIVCQCTSSKIEFGYGFCNKISSLFTLYQIMCRCKNGHLSCQLFECPSPMPACKISQLYNYKTNVSDIKQIPYIPSNLNAHSTAVVSIYFAKCVVLWCIIERLVWYSQNFAISITFPPSRKDNAQFWNSIKVECVIIQKY